MIESSDKTKELSYNMFFKALSNRTRFEIIQLLRKGPRNVTEICNELNFEHTRVSHNLKRLEKHGFVNSRRDGKNKIYSLEKRYIVPIMDNIDQHIEKYSCRLEDCGIIKKTIRLAKIKVNMGVVDSVKLVKTLSKSGLKKFPSLLKQVRANGIGSLLNIFGINISPMMQFFYGNRECYGGLIITERGKIKHVLYSFVDNGRVREVGSVKSKINSAAELYRELGKRGEVAKVITYDIAGGDFSFHPQN